jgi:hypothetical protein
MATPTALPAAFTVGEVLTSANMNLLRGAFRVLQVVQGTTATQVSNSTSTYADTGLTATITPTSTSSKIFVITAQDIGKDNGNTENRIQMRLLRGASEITQSGDLLAYTGSAIFNIISHSFAFLDSPATVSATTYKTQIKNLQNVASVKAQYGSGTSTITLMEISA